MAIARWHHRGATPEAAGHAELPGGALPYTLRRSSRARVLRVVIHPDRGVVVTIPARTVRPEHERRATAFLPERGPRGRHGSAGGGPWPSGAPPPAVAPGTAAASRSVAGFIACGSCRPSPAF